MKMRVEISADDLRQMVVDHIETMTGQSIMKEFVRIEVKSKQNYKSEWEGADFRAVFEVSK